MKFEFNWPSGFRGEDVWKCWRTDGRRTTDDGRRSHWYTNSSPRSLRLRWANEPQHKFTPFVCRACTVCSLCMQNMYSLLPLYAEHAQFAPFVCRACTVCSLCMQSMQFALIPWRTSKHFHIYYAEHVQFFLFYADCAQLVHDFFLTRKWTFLTNEIVMVWLDYTHADVIMSTLHFMPQNNWNYMLYYDHEVHGHSRACNFNYS